ncbi:hypothetical protein EJB05_24031 [Eragrostis curvula]|uniref:F-box domain-containing protein n=1 Tax=Eragrostis curvula TaxID=38414 RepID=A0A5J9V8K4_9POAL|nr:hypothetical protein EJB05_24031 [Eragrostis curvula]
MSLSPPPLAEAEAEGEGETRDWSEMPSDALAAVLAKLDATELLTGAGLVCRAWRRLAATDPTLWRRVDMSHQGDLLETEEAEDMARAAVDRAAGTMEAFWADSFVTDGLLRYISQRASSLKSLQLSLCDNVSNEGFAEAIKGFPQLEELDITFCSLYGSVCSDFEVDMMDDLLDVVTEDDDADFDDSDGFEDDAGMYDDEFDI